MANSIGDRVGSDYAELVRTGRILQSIFVCINNEALLFDIQRQGFPRHCKEFFSHAKRTTEGKYHICHLASVHVQHDILDTPEVVALKVTNVIAKHRVNTHQSRGSTIGAICAKFAIDLIILIYD